MNVLLDTCVVIDFLQKREPFAQDALRIFQMIAMHECDGFITAKSATDIFYLTHRNTHRNTHSSEQSRVTLQGLLQIVGVLDTKAEDVCAALFSPVSDFEDAVMIETGKRIKADCIVTRNSKHYTGSSVPVYEPAEFIKLLSDVR